MTLNLKNDFRQVIDDDHFKVRSLSIEEMVRWHNPDIIGVQELTETMLPYFHAMGETYIFYGSGRCEKGSPIQERCCILFKKDKFSFVEGSTFWLSDTPDNVGSKYIGSVFPRIATIAVLKDKETGTLFTVCNTHLDHISGRIRFKQACVLQKELEKRKKGEFLIVTGDFNSVLLQPPLQLLLAKENPLCLQPTVCEADSCTLRFFTHGLPRHTLAIDHILISRSLKPVKTEIIHSLFMGVYPSDHYPTIVTIES